MRERSFAGSRSGPNRSTQRSCSGAGGEGEKGSEGPGWAFRQPLPNRRFVSAIFRGARATSQRSRGRDAGSRGGNRYPSPDRPRRRDRQVMHVEHQPAAPRVFVNRRVRRLAARCAPARRWSIGPTRAAAGPSGTRPPGAPAPWDGRPDGRAPRRAASRGPHPPRRRQPPGGSRRDRGVASTST